MKLLLSGNEAIALGAWEAGVQYAAAYPGTPSTEILENFAKYPGTRAEWASNEKVALDNAAGASFGGARALVAMKHVGVNVAADSLMSISYLGVEHGLVLVSADDPGAFSSQNEQDNRQYTRFGRIPCFDPSNSEEAHQFVKFALDVSELFTSPVILRTTTRLSHSKSVVEATLPEERELALLPPYKHAEQQSRVITPELARLRHPVIEQRLVDLGIWADTLGFELGINRIEWGNLSLGIITSGITYHYVHEIFPEASILKIGMSYPLPMEKIRAFAEKVKKLIVIEELDPFIEDQIKAAGITVAHGKDVFPGCGELTLAKVRAAAVQAGLLPTTDESILAASGEKDPINIPARPPALCPGCPHRAFFYALSRNKRKTVIAGDIGCYTMGVLAPFEAMDMLISMGASIGMAHGFKQAGGQENAIATIGDSTFFHSGMAPLASAVYNRANITVAVLDNRTTAMTGQQNHPGTGVTLQGMHNKEIDIADVVRAMGVTYIEEVNAWDVINVNKIIRAALRHEDGPAVIIVRGACVFTPYFQYQPPMHVDQVKCVACGSCLRVGCPAITKSDEIYPTNNKAKSSIDPLLCTGCTVCMQVCPTEAIQPVQG
ncbi:MAG: indolepyruvate ferredoxin oxidoreductase subunit alpha [Anaerolineales bacterium]|nr:MAG: indolepyruvate ferredoxin oxidoreductase subunit alpha [Anaerolineales bacterium]